jgi:hypothetical protein
MSNAGHVPTWSGRRVNVIAPAAESIVIEDIAAALSCENRWAGHLQAPISVAQHSIGVSFLLPPRLALWGLLHDASEAYLKDIPADLKALSVFAGYRVLEALLQKTIYLKFGLSGDPPPELEEADRLVAAMEARDLFPAIHEAWAVQLRPRYSAAPVGPLLSWPAPKARAAFLRRFEVLNDRRIGRGA